MDTQPSLSPGQLKQLLHALRNEFDMCFRERVLHVFKYLRLADQDKLLDSGCGRGFFLNMAHSISKCELTGVELDKDIISEAAKNLRGKKINIIHGDIERLPFEDCRFNKIIFSEVLEHIPNEERALTELWRVLEPGGTIALTVPNQSYPFLWDPLNWLMEALFDTPIRSGPLAGIWANHQRLYTIDKLKAVVAAAGFRVEATNFLTHFCFPFSHNLLYGLGKELLIHGILPDWVSKNADRSRYDESSSAFLNPMNLLKAFLLKIDRLNHRYPPKQVSVVIAMKLSKPVC